MKGINMCKGWSWYLINVILMMVVVMVVMIVMVVVVVTIAMMVVVVMVMMVVMIVMMVVVMVVMIVMMVVVVMSQSEARKDKLKLPSAPPVRGSFQRFPSDWSQVTPQPSMTPGRAKPKGKHPSFKCCHTEEGALGRELALVLTPNPSP